MMLDMCSIIQTVEANIEAYTERLYKKYSVQASDGFYGLHIFEKFLIKEFMSYRRILQD
jgi:hypothetical protein